MQYKPVMPNEPLKTGWNTKFGVKITEFVKKESDKFEPPFMEHPIDMFQSGLTKGLEIAEGFSEWKENNYIKVWNKYCHRHGVLEDIGSHKTTSQLLEIYLTENEKK